MLVKHAFDHRHRFTRLQQTVVEQLWFSVRDQQHRRKHGHKPTGKLDMTAFERLERHYASEDMSIRKGVGGSGGRASITWLG